MGHPFRAPQYSGEQTKMCWNQTPWGMLMVGLPIPEKQHGMDAFIEYDAHCHVIFNMVAVVAPLDAEGRLGFPSIESSSS